MSLPVIAIWKKRTGFLVLLFSFLLAGMVVVSASMGYVQIEIADLVALVKLELSSIFLPLHQPDQLNQSNQLDPIVKTIIMDVRLPRILVCAAVGGSLALAGVVFQGILLNPLADPYTLGVSAGAAFGASAAILLGLGGTLVSIPIFAFAGACLTLFAVIYLSFSGANRQSNFSSNSLILSGIIVAAILSAGISFIKYLADEQVSAIIFWLMGSFSSKTWEEVGLTWAVLGVGLGVSMFFSRDLNLVCLGDRSASSLGVDTRRTTLILLVTGSLVAAVSVSVSGIIGFVGLLVPHMVRTITGPDHGRLIPISILTGALLLLGADTITRAVLPHEIPIGVLTALIGGPVFCWIFKKSQAR